MKPKGGRRPGAGRKSKAEEAGLLEFLGEAFPQADRAAVIKALVKEAKFGNVQAAALLLNYAYGKPAQRVEHAAAEDAPLQIQIVEIRAPGSKKAG